MTTTTKRPYAPLPAPISAADAAAEPSEARVFADKPARAYPAKLYTIDAIDPDGYPVHFTFTDISIEQFEEKKEQMKALGYLPPTQAAAAPVATPDDLPEGWKLCHKHGAPMRPRNKQNQTWHSHNVGTRDNPIYCKGYRGSDSPGYEVE